MTDPRRTDLAALSRYARDKGTSHPARDLILGAVEEIATLRLRLDQATTAAAELRTLPEVHTAEQHKAEAERLLDLANNNHRAIATTETDADVAADQLRSVGLLLDAAQVNATLATIPDMVELLVEGPTQRCADDGCHACYPVDATRGYRVGPRLGVGVQPWRSGWEQTPLIDDGHAHEWERVTVHPRVGGDEVVVRCAICHAPRCGHSTDADPCMERRHHRTCHRYLSGRIEHVGGSAGSCGCAGT